MQPATSHFNTTFKRHVADFNTTFKRHVADFNTMFKRHVDDFNTMFKRHVAIISFNYNLYLLMCILIFLDKGKSVIRCCNKQFINKNGSLKFKSSHKDESLKKIAMKKIAESNSAIIPNIVIIFLLILKRFY